MNGLRVFLDTWFVEALLDPRDSAHAEGSAWYPVMLAAMEVVMTEAVLLEVCDSLAELDRQRVTAFIRQCRELPNLTIIPLDPPLFARGFEMYTRYRDKEWGLTDCISFLTMADRQVQMAATADRHFRQAGFVILFERPRSRTR